MDATNTKLDATMTYKQIIVSVLNDSPDIRRADMVKIIADVRKIDPKTANTKLSNFAKVTRDADGKKILVLKEKVAGKATGTQPHKDVVEIYENGDLNLNVNDLIIKDWKGHDYIPNKYGGTTDIKLLQKKYENRHDPTSRFPCFVGETGCGKTTAGKWFAFQNGLPYFSFNLNGQTTVDDFVGQMIPTDEAGKFAWVDGVVTAMAKHGGFLVIEEINFAPEKILAKLNSLIDIQRRIILSEKDGSTIHAHPDFFVMATMNPDDYAGVNVLNPAFKDRWDFIVLDYNNVAERKLLKNERLVEMAKSLRTAKKNDQIITPTSTRALLSFENNVDLLGFDTAKQIFVDYYEPEERSAIEEVFDDLMNDDDGRGYLHAMFGSTDPNTTDICNYCGVEFQNHDENKNGKVVCP